MTSREADRRRRLVERARRLLPELPTGSLYRINALLERILAADQVDERVYHELEQALSRRRKPKPKDL